VLNPGTTTITSTFSGQSVQADAHGPRSDLPVRDQPAARRKRAAVNFAVPLLAAYSDGHNDVNVSAATGVVRTSSDTTAPRLLAGVLLPYGARV
jgi:hypothetical protein